MKSKGVSCLVRLTAAVVGCVVVSAWGQAGRAVLDFDEGDFAWLAPGGQAVLAEVPVPGVALAAGGVTIELERFSVTTPGTRFVVGSPNGKDRPLDFDPSEVVLMRGQIAGDPHSHAFVSVYQGEMSGRFELGSGERFAITSRAGGGRMMPAGQALVLADHASGGSLPGCGVDTSALLDDGGEVLAEARPGLFQVEVAVETDYELYEQFWDLDAEAAYLVQVYGAVSDIYIRDVGTSIVLTYARLWDDPNDLFNIEDPLGQFRDYWNANMGAVHRDIAQFFSGRVNFWYGGVAWLSAVCGDHGYSVSGYMLGYFADPDQPSVFNRDIMIPAHEMGHNLGTGHTQDYGIDTCHLPETPAQRGPIMAYCGQTHTGGDANHDLRFHTITAGKIRELLAQRGCVALDCNLNGTADDIDIADGVSADANANGVPDECEDCNANGVLDPQDIADGTSADINANGRPDECEPDCNANGLPDGYDIAQGASTDAYGNGVPDECETDCNDNAISDNTEINLDMTLDLDRDARLDACEDCDNDGVIDLVALDGANDVWVADKLWPNLREFLGVTGTVVRDSDNAGLAEPSDVLALPDGRVLAASRLDGRVVEFDHRGGLVGDLVPAGGGGLSSAGAMLISPRGELLIASGATDSVKAYDPQTGAYLGDLVAPGAGGLVGPFGVAISAEGTLLVTSADNRVLEYSSADGAFIREFVAASDNGGLDKPRGLLVLPTGNVLVASWQTSTVLEFDRETGAFVRQFNRGGTADRMTLDQPWCMRLGPDGDVYISRAHDHARPPPPPGDTGELHLTNARIFAFDVDSGKMIRAYVQSLDSGIEHPTGFDFLRGDLADCNLNLVPDSCDIALGTSMDVDGDAIPDECQGGCVADYNRDGAVNTLDFIAYLDDWANRRPRADINDDLVVDTRDFLAFLGLWSAGC